MRLIDADALDLVPDIHNAMNGVIFVNHPRSGGRTQMIVQQLLTRMISNAPTIDAVPVVHGRWVRSAGRSHIWYCSVCGDKINYKQNRRTYNIPKVPVGQKNKFCRNCGAKMDLKEATNEENPDPV